MKVEEKLAIDAFKTDNESHITINQEICHTKCKVKILYFSFTGHLYSFNERIMRWLLSLQVVWVNCKIACLEGAINWLYPKEFRVFRFG